MEREKLHEAGGILAVEDSPLGKWTRRAGTTELDVRITMRGPGAAVVHLRGTAGMAEAQMLADRLDALVQREVPRIVLDLDEMEFIGSAGLGVFLTCRQKALAYGGEVRLAGPGPIVREIIRRTRLEGLFGIYTWVEQALL